jgi:hypothetical protein
MFTSGNKSYTIIYMSAKNLVIAGLLILASSSPPQASTALTEQQNLLKEPCQTFGSGFSEGFRDGYRKAHPMGLCPIPPLPPLGKNSYEDGFGMGYMRGLMDKN